MKRILIIVGIVAIGLSLFINVVAYFTVSFNYDFDKEALREKTAKIFYLNKSYKKLNSLNNALNDSLGGDFKYTELKEMVDSTFEKIYFVESRLIEITGGFTEHGTMVNPTAKSFIDRYFFTQNTEKTEGQLLVDELLINYYNRFSQITGMESELAHVYKLYDLKAQQSPVRMFRDCTLSEAQSILDQLRIKIELDLYKYLVSIVRKKMQLIHNETRPAEAAM